MNYIEEVARRIWAESGRDDYELEELVTALQEVDRRARAERDEQWRTHLNVILGTELYKLHEKHFTNLTPQL